MPFLEGAPVDRAHKKKARIEEQPPTLADVAEQAGVSIATASRVLNGVDERHTPQTTERVRLAAMHLGYAVNAQARSLRTSNSGFLGLAVPDLSGPSATAVIQGAEKTCKEHRKGLLVTVTDGRTEGVQGALQALASRRADAIVYLSDLQRGAGSMDTPALRATVGRFLEGGGRLVSIGHRPRSAEPEDGVLIDVPYGTLAAELSSSLCAGGYELFTVVATRQPHWSSKLKTEAFLESLREGGVNPASFLFTETGWAGGFSAGVRLATEIRAAGGMDRGRCLFVTEEKMALGVREGLGTAGLVSSCDYTLACIADSPDFVDCFPEAVTVQAPWEAIGRSAAKQALKLDSSL